VGKLSLLAEDNFGQISKRLLPSPCGPCICYSVGFDNITLVVLWIFFSLFAISMHVVASDEAVLHAMNVH